MSSTLSVGFGGFGGLALDTYKTQTSLVEAPLLSSLDIQSISVGLWHSLIVTTSGHLYGVGRNRYGALGLGEPESLDVLNYTLPIEVKEPFSTSPHHRVSKASVGKTHSLVLTCDGTLFSFGFGMGCGHGTSSMCGIPEPIQYLFSHRIVDCSAGEGHSAAVSETGKLFTWGLENRHKPVMVRNANIDSEIFVSVACGTHHAFALTENGKLFGYGRNCDGQVSKDGASHISEEFLVEIVHPDRDSSHWVQVSCGMRHTIALDNIGNVYIWGRIKTTKSDRNELNSTNSEILPPTLFSLPISKGNIKKVVSSYSSFVILTNDGTVYSWGHNLHYNLGHGHGKYVHEPTLISAVAETFIGDVFIGGYNMFLVSGVSFTASYAKLLRETQYYADCILKSRNGHQTICHAAILSARSPYLASLLMKEYLELSNTEQSLKDSKFKTIDPSHIERVITLDFIESQEELDEILNYIYTNATGRSAKSEKLKCILNDHINNTQKAIEILEDLKQTECLSEDQRNDLSIMIEIVQKEMVHEPIKGSSLFLVGDLSEYTRDFENLYKLAESSSGNNDPDVNSIFSYLSDVSFSLDDGTFIRSHRCILCSRLEYFRAMFSIGQFSESFQKSIHLDNTTRDSFEILLKYIYTGGSLNEQDLTAEQSVPLLELSTRFNIDTLKLAAERKIVLYLQPSNVLQMCQVAELCQAEIVKKCCIHLIARNFNDYSPQQLEDELDSHLIETITNLHKDFVHARSLQESNEMKVFQYMKEQEDAFNSLLEDGERQHLVDEYDEEDIQVIQSILHGKHDPKAPVHTTPIHSHSSPHTKKKVVVDKRGGQKMNSQSNCLFM